jgi:hypothetical protein
MFGSIFGKNTAIGKRGEPIPENNDGEPDSATQAGLCPRCEKQLSFHIFGSIPLTFDGGRMIGRGDEPDEPTYTERATVLICHHCKQGVCVLEEKWIGGRRWTEKQGGGNIIWQGFHWWPYPGVTSHKAIPLAIADAMHEATLALSANCLRASAVMARRSLEAIAVDQGETKGALADKLKNLATRGLLQPTLAEWAKEVRLVGNTGAHFDPITVVDSDDAKQLIEFVRELAKYLYVLPYELQARRAAKP